MCPLGPCFIVSHQFLCYECVNLHNALARHACNTYYNAAVFVSKTIEVRVDAEDYMTTISSEGNTHQQNVHMEIKIPKELLLSVTDGGTIRAVSFLYSNLEHLFPSGLPGEENQ